jgi:hypothetical protein
VAEIYLDSEADPAAVGAQIKKVLSSRGQLRLAVAYVTGNFADLLGLRQLRWPDVSLVCDPFGGSCDPRLLKRLHKAGVRISCRPKLHAKVFISRTGAIVGSANISAPALGRGNTEGACFVSDRATLKTAASWFDSLFASAAPISTLIDDPFRWGQIEAAWRARTRAERPQDPHLRDALYVKGSQQLDRCVFSMWSIPTGNDRHALAAARSVGLPLAEHWTYEAVPYGGKAHEHRLKKASEHKVVLYLKVRDDKDNRVRSFTSLSSTAWNAEHVLVHKNEIYTYLQRVQSPVRLSGKETKLLIRELNHGLRRHPEVARHLDCGEFATAATIAKLLD